MVYAGFASCHCIKSRCSTRRIENPSRVNWGRRIAQPQKRITRHPGIWSVSWTRHHRWGRRCRWPSWWFNKYSGIRFYWTIFKDWLLEDRESFAIEEGFEKHDEWWIQSHCILPICSDSGHARVDSSRGSCIQRRAHWRHYRTVESRREGKAYWVSSTALRHAKNIDCYRLLGRRNKSAGLFQCSHPLWPLVESNNSRAARRESRSFWPNKSRGTCLVFGWLKQPDWRVCCQNHHWKTTYYPGFIGHQRSCSWCI